MKKIFASLGLLAAVYMAGVFWSANWLDEADVNLQQNPIILKSTSFFWAISPTFDTATDTQRALNVSFMRVSGEIYKKNKTWETKEIVDLLAFESQFLENYAFSHRKNIRNQEVYKISAMLLLYLNRVWMYQTAESRLLDEGLEKITNDMELASQDDRESWYREMMIRSYFLGKEDDFQKYKKNFSNQLAQNVGVGATNFSEGAEAFYEGALLCISNKPTAAQPVLKTAIKKFEGNPRAVSYFFSAVLNVLIASKASGGHGTLPAEKKICANLVEKAILKGL